MTLCVCVCVCVGWVWGGLCMACVHKSHACADLNFGWAYRQIGSLCLRASKFKVHLVRNSWETGSVRLLFTAEMFSGERSWNERISRFDKTLLRRSRFDPTAGELYAVPSSTPAGSARKKDGPSSRRTRGASWHHAYPDLQEDAGEHLALTLGELNNPTQVSFGVKRRRPKSIDDAVAATMELEACSKTRSKG